MERQLTLDEWLELQERKELGKGSEWDSERLMDVYRTLVGNAATINKGIPGVHRIDPEEWFIVYG